MASKDVETPEILLQPPNSFPFPFDAYAIQVDFMKSLYSTLEDGCFGIFESPTGTVCHLNAGTSYTQTSTFCLHIYVQII